MLIVLLEEERVAQSATMSEGEHYQDDSHHVAAMSDRESRTYGYLNSNNTMEALKSSLAHPPLGCRDQGVLKQNTDLVLTVIQGVKDADVKKHIDSLSEEECDVLMKYVYKGFERATNSASLLKWHEVLREKYGQGIIVRAIVDRYNV
jgi:actin related protein 2/3 complex subunit 5